MDIQSCNLILVCFFGLSAFNLFPSLIKCSVSWVINCPRLSKVVLLFHLGQRKEEEGRQRWILFFLVLQPLWSKFFIFSCEDKCVIHHLEVSSFPLAPLQVLTMNINIRYQNPLPWWRKGFKIDTAAVWCPGFSGLKFWQYGCNCNWQHNCKNFHRLAQNRWDWQGAVAIG